MTALVLTPFTADDAVELGNRQWWKRLLPIGEIDYKGRTLRFTRDYLASLADAFRDRAYDQVAFQLADHANTHTNDPERFRGEIAEMRVRDDGGADENGLWVRLKPTDAGDAVLASNPRLGVSARIVEDYARSDGKHYPAAIQHVLGTLDPRIPGLGPWQAIEAASPVPDTVIDLSASVFAGQEPPVELARPWLPSKEYWAGVGKSGGNHPPDRGGSDEEKADNHISDAKKAASMGMHTAAASHLARASALTQDPAKQQAINTAGKGAASLAVNAGQGAAYHLAGDAADIFTEGADAMPDLDSLTPEQQAKLAKLLELPDDQLDALAAGGMVLTAAELEALTGPDGGDENGGLSDAELDELVAAAGELDAAGLLGDDGAPQDGTTDYIPEGEPVSAGLSAEAQFAINLANARAEETQRELSVITARLREEDYQGEKRRLADLGVPPYITELARPLLEGAGHAVELANGRTVDSGAIMRRVLTEYARQARLLDLGAELGSPMDEPEDAAGEQQAQQRDDVVARYKAATGLR